MNPIDHCHARLARAGWSIGEVRIMTAAGPLWQVDGANGENVIVTRGATQTAAWEKACWEAMALGMLQRWTECAGPEPL